MKPFANAEPVNRSLHLTEIDQYSKNNGSQQLNLQNGEIMKALNINSLSIGQSLTGDGIEARRTKRGVAYYSSIMVAGQRIRQLLGRESEGYNLSRAKSAIIKIRVDAEDPEKRDALSKRRPKQLLFRAAAKDYIDMLLKTGGKNVPQKAQQLRDHLTPYFGMMPVGKISTANVDAYKSRRLEAGGTTSTIDSELAVLSHLYTMMKEWEWHMNQPFLCKKFNKPNIKIEVFTPDQSHALLHAAKEDADPYTYLFILLGLNTGMRHAEILTLRYEHINYIAARIFLPDAKAGSRYQPFPKSLIAPLQKHQVTLEDRNGWVFPARSETGHRTYMKKQFARTVERAGLAPRRFTPHTMRHTAITRLIEAGHPLEVVRQISGHKTIQMVMRYTHVANSVVDDALDSVVLC